MKRNILAITFVICVQFGVFGQNNSPIDLVLLLNISSDMSSSYENVSNYITGPFLSEYLRIGDTFHLITFSASSRLDSARRILGIGDVETIIGRMFIQYPVENGSNMAAAISFTERYLASLPLRQKKIVIVSTGGSEIDNLVNAARQRFSQANATLDFVQITPGQPLTKLPVSGRPGAGTLSSSMGTTSQAAPPAPAARETTISPPSPTTGTVSQAAPAAPSSTGMASQAAPAAMGTTTSPPSPTTGTVSQAAPAAPSAIGTTAPPVSSSSTEAVSASAPAVSSSAGTASNEPSSSPQKTDSSNQIDAVQNTPSPSPARNESSSANANTLQTGRAVKTGSFSVPVIAGIIVLLLLILGLIIFFASRRLSSSPNRVMAEVSASRDKREEKLADHSKDLAKYAAVQTRQRTSPYSDRPLKSESVSPLTINPTGPLLLNMFVEDQNTAIGRRNIHSLKSGYSLTVGGGKSDFIIFLVPIPANIGELRRSGSQITFIPRKPKFFPDLGSNELRDCLNKTIRIVSDKGYELRFRFEMYEDPLVTLNRVLLQIKVPG